MLVCWRSKAPVRALCANLAVIFQEHAIQHRSGVIKVLVVSLDKGKSVYIAHDGCTVNLTQDVKAADVLLEALDLAHQQATSLYEAHEPCGTAPVSKWDTGIFYAALFSSGTARVVRVTCEKGACMQMCLQNQKVSYEDRGTTLRARSLSCSWVRVETASKAGPRKTPQILPASAENQASPKTGTQDTSGLSNLP